MKDGVCPKCQAATVYRRLEGISHGGGGIYISTFSSAAERCDVTYYVCATCGYVESYLYDEEKLSDVARTWRKVK
ncbi:MAG TPA: hypothetical protein VF659_23355 [Pyrinomonadaceae bacterium]